MIRPARHSQLQGFTLAEVAVTIVIVGIGLVLVLQGLNTAKLTAAQTRNQKLARELGLYTLGQVESGVYRDDVSEGLRGDYSQEGWPDFSYEVAVGDQSFTEEAVVDPNDPSKPWDNWAQSRAAQDDQTTEEEEDEEQQEPYEKVRIRVRFPRLAEAKNELVLERWVPWEQVYGESTDETTATDGTTPTDGANSGTGAPTGANTGSTTTGGAK